MKYQLNWHIFKSYEPTPECGRSYYFNNQNWWEARKKFCQRLREINNWPLKPRLKNADDFPTLDFHDYILHVTPFINIKGKQHILSKSVMSSSEILQTLKLECQIYKQSGKLPQSVRTISVYDNLIDGFVEILPDSRALIPIKQFRVKT